MKTVFPSGENVFLTNALFRIVKTDVLSSGLSIFFIQSFVEAFEIRGWQLLLVETDFLAIRTYFFSFLRYSF